MRTKNSGSVSLATCSLLLASFVVGESHPANAQSYEFVVLARKNDVAKREFYTFEGTPRITSDGTVYFLGIHRINEVSTRGVFAIRDGELHEIVSSRDTEFRKIDEFAVNDNGCVAFIAHLKDRGPGMVCLYDHGTTYYIADTTGDIKRLQYPEVNNAGQVTFLGGLDLHGHRHRIYRGQPKEDPIVIAHHGDTFSRLFGLPSINDDGVVAFRGELKSGGAGVFVGEGEVEPDASEPKTQLLHGTQDGFTIISSTVFMGNDGQVTFMGVRDGKRGLYRGDGRHLSTIVDTGGPLRRIFGYRSSKNGRVLFMSETDNFKEFGSFGLFTGPDIKADVIIQIRDPLLGKQLAGISDFDISGTGRIAMVASLKTKTESDTYLLVAKPIE